MGNSGLFLQKRNMISNIENTHLPAKGQKSKRIGFTSFGGWQPVQKKEKYEFKIVGGATENHYTPSFKKEIEEAMITQVPKKKLSIFYSVSE